jgi:hypothetical protein
MKEVMGKERMLMEERLAQSLVRDQMHTLDKNMTVKQIVDDERKLLADRFQTDIDRMKNTNMRVLVEKEATLLELQTVLAKLQGDLKSCREQNELAEAKVRALE